MFMLAIGIMQNEDMVTRVEENKSSCHNSPPYRMLSSLVISTSLKQYQGCNFHFSLNSLLPDNVLCIFQADAEDQCLLLRKVRVTVKTQVNQLMPRKVWIYSASVSDIIT